LKLLQWGADVPIFSIFYVFVESWGWYRPLFIHMRLHVCNFLFLSHKHPSILNLDWLVVVRAGTRFVLLFYAPTGQNVVFPFAWVDVHFRCSVELLSTSGHVQKLSLLWIVGAQLITFGVGVKFTLGIKFIPDNSMF